MPEKYILKVLGGNLGYTLKDSDLWGISCALQHSIDNGYFTGDNRDWAEDLLDSISKLRDKVPPPACISAPPEPAKRRYKADPRD